MTGPAEIHDELRAVAADLLAKNRAPDWPVLAAAGWTGLEIPEALGGAGVTFAETAVVCEEMGRAATASAFLGGAVLAVGALAAAPAGTVRDELLAGIAAGTTRAAVVCDGLALRDGRLYGRAEFVPDAPGADVLLVLAGDGVVVAEGLRVDPRQVLDETRRLADVSADGAAVQHHWPIADPQRVRDRAAVALAADSVGIGAAMLDATVGYTAMRHQFGRPIGSFQAVKHACADMFVRLQVARRLVADAAAAIAAHAPDAPLRAAMAKSYAGTAGVDIAGKAMQLHGGIGYTWESGIHAYLKRAALNRTLFGSPQQHRRRIARHRAATDSELG
ncbi:acyl-CoA dehydrogenase family protein [uncultured Mycolicibacterium sp.]|uniref:acyl-CoA dehydrogenase family protein n=1 Tax=uncultured Mycolicibacterium sp. TaxID=2320817 RepID=UPI0026296461|nr:acyl-CoA dehydrogenase family protein [uncultured Mycolicibacterium sp.]